VWNQRVPAPRAAAHWADELGQEMLREFGGKHPGITVEAVNVQAGGNMGKESTRE
jgi:hypothetical protein